MALTSQRNGAAFEGIFERACIYRGLATTRFPAGCQVLPGGRLRRVQTPCDWIISYQGKTAIIDTKTCEGHFGHSAIEKHQSEELAVHNAAGVRAGYIIWMRKRDFVVYVSGTELEYRRLYAGRGSIEPNQPNVVTLGGLATFDPRQIFL